MFWREFPRTSSSGYFVSLRYLRCRCYLPRPILIRPEAQDRRDVSSAIQFRIVLQIKQFNVAADSDGDDRIANVIQFTSRAAASDARRNDVRVEMSAVRTFHGPRGVILTQKERLDFSGLEGAQHATQASHTATVRFGEVNCLRGLGTTAF